MNHFDLVTFAKYRVGVLTARDDVLVQLDGNAASDQFEARKQPGNGFAVRQFERVAVQLNAHAVGSHHFWGSVF